MGSPLTLSRLPVSSEGGLVLGVLPLWIYRTIFPQLEGLWEPWGQPAGAEG